MCQIKTSKISIDLQLDATKKKDFSLLPEGAETYSYDIMTLFFPNLRQLRLPEGLDEVQISKLMEVNKRLKNFDVEIISKGQKKREVL